MDIIVNTNFPIRNKQTGNVYDAQFAIERHAGFSRMVRAWIWIDTEHPIFFDAYKPTITEATDCLRAQLRDWVKV